MLLAAATVVTALYALTAAIAAGRLRRVPAPPHVPDRALPPVSVLVAARDEEAALPACLDALAAQDYPPDRLEILVADDHSRDATAEVVERRAARDRRFRLVRVGAEPDHGLRGKARALHAAVRRASGDLLLVTDADCRPAPSWARALGERLTQAPQTGIVGGVTTVAPEHTRGALQQLDWLLLLGVSAAASAAGRPLTAMGNNMGVRRAAYDAVGGYPALPFSVTEDYALFRAVHQTTPFTVHLVADPALHVATEPVATLRDAFAQRRRWARGGLHADTAVHAFYIFVFAAHALLAGAALLAPPAALPLLAVKTAGDAAVIASAAGRTGASPRWWLLPLYEALLTAYVVAMPFALALAPRIRWKKRTI